jgi:flagellar FliJ protein
LARFSFRLQNILNLKARLEEQQKNVFAAARKRLDDEEEKLNILYKRLEGYEEEGRDLRKEALPVFEIIENESAISRMKDFIEDQKLEVKKAEDALEEERLKLVEMMQERKMYEKLRERAFERYLEEEKHEESVQNDERNSYVYGTSGS